MGLSYSFFSSFDRNTYFRSSKVLPMTFVDLFLLKTKSLSHTTKKKRPPNWASMFSIEYKYPSVFIQTTTVVLNDWHFQYSFHLFCYLSLRHQSFFRNTIQLVWWTGLSVCSFRNNRRKRDYIHTSKERRKMHHADFQSICARSTDIRRGESKVVIIHTERMTEKKNIASSLFYLIMDIQSLITTAVVFPICQCRISHFSSSSSF